MNVKAVKRELQQSYPGVNIKQRTDAEGAVTEIVGEIDRKLINSKRDVAVVITDRSPEHYHDVITEEYEVFKGSLRVFLNGDPVELSEGESVVIEPGTHHYAEGDETWFYCYSEPDWTSEDFHMVENEI